MPGGAPSLQGRVCPRISGRRVRFPSAHSVRASRRSDPLNGSSGDGSLPLVGAPYVVRWPLTAKTLVPAMLGTALLVGWLALWPGIGGHRPPAIFWAFLVLVLVLRAGRIRNGRIAFEVGPAGIRMSEPVTLYGGRLVAVPWRSIAEVVVLPPRVSSPADLGTSVGAVGVRLRPDAPLPGGVRGIIREPSGAGPLLTRRVQGWTLDRTRLMAAVSSYAPGVPVVELPANA